MIASFRDDWLRDFFIADARSGRIPADLRDRLFRKIQMIDDATTDQDLRVPPSNHLERLRGKLARFLLDTGQQAMAACVPLGWRQRRSKRCLS